MSSIPAGSSALLLEKLRKNGADSEALRALWQPVLPPETVPDVRQLTIWLLRFGFTAVEQAIQKTGSKYLKAGAMDKLYTHAYCGRCLSTAARDAEDSHGNRR